jgi:hypothetical protein
MLKRTCLAIIALLAALVSVGKSRSRRVVLLAALTLFAIGVVAWGDVPVPNPNARGKAESVEQAAERTARKYLAPLLNKPTRLSKISVKDCERTAQRPWNLCTVKVDGVAADCTLRLRLRVFPSDTYSAYGRSLRCR